MDQAAIVLRTILVAKWILFALYFTVLESSAQQTVYRCVEEDGSTTFSDQPCSEDPDVLHIEESHNPAPPRQYLPRASTANNDDTGRANSSPAPPSSRQAISYRCSIDTGEVWYLHSPCPSRVTIREIEDLEFEEGWAEVSREVTVDQTEVSRSSACSQIYAVGTSRRGSDRDESYTTYERNMGRDPCR